MHLHNRYAKFMQTHYAKFMKKLTPLPWSQLRRSPQTHWMQQTHIRRRPPVQCLRLARLAPLLLRLAWMSPLSP